MYGPDEMTFRPYSPAFVKHLPTSSGIGPAAGMLSRNRKSPVGCVSVNLIVLSSGVSMPEIVLASPAVNSAMPLMTV